MDDIIWWIGITTASVGAVGVIAILATWAIEVVLKLTGFSKALIEAYARLQTERMHERQLHG